MTRMKQLAIAGTVAAVLGLAVAPQAYTIAAKWTTLPVVVYTNPQNLDVTPAAADTAIKAAMTEWSTKSGSALKIFHGGNVSDTTTGYNGRNVIIFRNASSGSALATTYSWYSGSTMVDADVIFWDGAYRFYTGTTGCSSGAYIEDIAAHELGHLVGIKHSEFADATMYPTYKYCGQVMRTLAADDIAAARANYPLASTNTPPVVTISTPGASSSVLAGVAITFSGSATDAEDGVLTPSATWSSSLSGSIGVGGSFVASLPVGNHVVTMAARDSAGVSSSRTVSVNVTNPVADAGSPRLSTRVWKEGKWHRVDLTWTGLPGPTVTIYRDGAALLSSANDGFHLDKVNRKGVAIYTYKVCAGTTCTNTATAAF